jgi:glyoxylase-like metal-dependent hydrolase (beta-lactamase superfamily II)
MRINEAEGVLQFQFPDTGEDLGLNIYAYVKGNEAVLIDNGFEQHFLEVKEELDNRSIEIKMVVQTHFHPDHIGGLPHLRHLPIYGSMYAEETLKKYYDDYEAYMPTVAVTEKMTVPFKDAEFTLIPNPSHSKCTMVILVDGLSFVGDECMFFDDESQSMPFASETIEMHRDGTKFLRTIIEGTLLCPAHGRMTRCTMYLKFVIMYFNHILKYPKQTYKQFSDLYQVQFKNTKLHSLNVSKVK